MTYVIAGVSGHTGRVVAETLLEAGHPVRVIVRDESKGQSWRARGAEVAIASFLDVDAMTRALEGAEGAYLLLAPHPGTSEYLSGQRQTVEVFAEALGRTRVPHVVFLSSIGAQLAEGTGPIRALHHAERRLRDVPAVAFTFLRAPYFMTNLASSLGGIGEGVFATFHDADRAVPMTATEDIGRAAAALLLGSPSATSIVELMGIDTTPRDAAKTFGALAKRELAVAVGPTSAMPDVLVGHGMPRDLAGLYAEMTEGFNTGRIGYEGSHATAKSTTPLTTVARALLGVA